MINNKKELKMSLEELRNAINIEKTEWNNKYKTNCYAYVLGLDIKEENIIENAYIPGTISDSEIELYKKEVFSYNELIQNLYSDLDFLRIGFREIYPNEKIAKDEWKVALFISGYYNQLDDYHFLRLCNDGIWHHKNGWNSMPTIYDSNGSIIKDPTQCFLRGRIFNKCLSLKLK